MTGFPHIGGDILLAYEAGSLSEGWALAVASHLAMCGPCRARAGDAAAIGGALLDDIEPVALEAGGLDRVMTKANDPAPVEARRNSVESAVPAPLQAYIGADLEALEWRQLGLTARQVLIKTGDPDTRVRLLRVAAGEAMPLHGHRGMEMTLVLTGSVHSENGILLPGDLEETGPAVVHTPRAGSESECICLAVTDAPLRFKSLAMRLAQPFLGI